MDKTQQAELARMIEWLALALVCYAAVYALHAAGIGDQVQTALWKMGNVTVAAFLGYWIDRRIFRRRITDDSPPGEQLRRAIIVGAAMLAVGLGL